MVSDYAPGARRRKILRQRVHREGRPGRRQDHVPARQSRTSRRSCSARPTPSPTPSSSSCRPARAAPSSSSSPSAALDKAGIKIIGPGDVTDDDLVNGMGDAVIGTVTAHIYSADHNSAANKAFVAAFEKANNGMRPNFMAVGAYDGMHLMYEALKKTGGKTDGDSLIAAMKGMAWESPRGPISIDPRDARHHPERLYPQGREGERRTLQCRIRHLPGGQGSDQGCGEVSFAHEEKRAGWRASPLFRTERRRPLVTAGAVHRRSKLSTVAQSGLTGC